MGIFLLILFAAAEITLTVLTCTKFRSVWHKNRALFCAAEFVVIFIFCIVPITGMRWRFTACAVILAIRFIISGIVYLAKRNKNAKEKSNGGAIASAVIGIFLIGVSLVPAYIFTGYNGLKTTGPYKVKTTEAILIDSSRLETHETDGSNREVPVHFYYPESGTDNCPFVLFAHGSFGYYQSNSSLYEELASNGYVVASIDHPYYAFFTTDTDGKIIIVDMDFMQYCVDLTNGVIEEKDSVPVVKEWLNTRAADENFVIDSMIAAKNAGSLSDAWFTSSDKVSGEINNMLKITDMSKIGLTGHSIGGATAVKLGRERGDISAVIDIDGTMFSEKISEDSDVYVYNEEPYPIPLLAFNNATSYDGGYSKDYRDEEGRVYIDVHVLNNALDAREYHIADTEHMDFTDLPLLSPTLASMFGKGTADPKKVVPEINSICLNFFNYYLKGEGELTVGKWVPTE